VQYYLEQIHSFKEYIVLKSGIVDGKLGIILKETAVAKSVPLSGRLFGETEERHENIDCDSRLQGLDLNQRPQK
jgi:hypothetical protein